jgi:hypothetical protein
MANGIYTASLSGISTGTSLKTLMELGTSANMRATILSWWVEFDGTSGSATPIKVELIRGTGGITGTSITAEKYTDKYDAAVTVAKHTASSEGTIGVTNALESHYVHPQSGILVQYPLDREIQIPVSAFLRLRVTAAASVNASVGIVWQE